MSRIRSKNTSLDKTMARILVKTGYEFTMYPKMFGSPDFLVESRLVVFCDSSFWHGRNWTKLKSRLAEGSNASYWVAHIDKNRRRDRAVSKELRKKGYSVVRLWDYDILKRPLKCSTTLSNRLELISARIIDKSDLPSTTIA